MDDITEMTADAYLFSNLTDVYESECDLAHSIGKRLPGGKVFNPGIAFGTRHKDQLLLVLTYLRQGPTISSVNDKLLHSIAEILLYRQGKIGNPYPCLFYWISVRTEPMPPDFCVEFIVTYSVMVVALLHLIAMRGTAHPDTLKRIEAAILKFFIGFGKDRFPSHGHDVASNYHTYATLFDLGQLQYFLVEHHREIPDFVNSAITLVQYEAEHGPCRSGFDTSPQTSTFSSLGDFCLQTLGEIERFKRLTRVPRKRRETCG